MIRWDAVGFTYDAGEPALIDADLTVESGEILLVAGASGSGKSTLLRTVNGLVPHASGGRFSGRVTTFGRDTRRHKPRDLADVVGFVHQDPEAQFVVDHVEHDVAFALENLGVDRAAMRRRVEEVLDAVGIAHLRDRSPTTLSGGEQQRAALAGAFAAAPAALVLDEPTSQLDPQGAEDVLAAVSRLNTELGTTVVLAEHRLDRTAPMADRVTVVAAGRAAEPESPTLALADYDGAPAVMRLARVLGWSGVPLTVRDARRLLDAARPPSLVAPEATLGATGEALLTATGVTAALGGTEVLHGIDLALRQGEVVALLGRNGAGKTTLLRALAGLLAPSKGRVQVQGRVAYVPQDPGSLLFSPTVRGEVAETLRMLRHSDESAVELWLDRLHLSELGGRHPRTLSGGERQRVAVAAVAVGGAGVLLLDEPTRGMDAASRRALDAGVRAHAAAGGAVVLATHDTELAARCADRVVVLGDGDVVAEGQARQVLAGSLFAPQVLRVLPPFLTVDEVVAAMAEVR